ncbi:hypothetical protein SK128_008353 [Halocaridina rubra]|uniref:Uncharacterized protein n=1 Tax=Halocaridina rubra TaxID=373956 RepID=A0AAN8X9E4_HALRR
MDELSQTPFMKPIDLQSLKDTFDMRLSEIEFENRFQNHFHEDLPPPESKTVTSFIYPSKKKKNPKIHAPSPTKPKNGDKGLYSYHLKTIQELAPILTQSATMLPKTSCTVKISLTSKNSRQSPIHRKISRTTTLASVFKLRQTSSLQLKKRPTFRRAIRRKNKSLGDLINTGNIEAPASSIANNYCKLHDEKDSPDNPTSVENTNLHLKDEPIKIQHKGQVELPNSILAPIVLNCHVSVDDKIQDSQFCISGEEGNISRILDGTCDESLKAENISYSKTDISLFKTNSFCHVKPPYTVGKSGILGHAHTDTGSSNTENFPTCSSIMKSTKYCQSQPQLQGSSSPVERNAYRTQSMPSILEESPSHLQINSNSAKDNPPRANNSPSRATNSPIQVENNPSRAEDGPSGAKDDPSQAKDSKSHSEDSPSHAKGRPTHVKDCPNDSSLCAENNLSLEECNISHGQEDSVSSLLLNNTYILQTNTKHVANDSTNEKDGLALLVGSPSSYTLGSPTRSWHSSSRIYGGTCWQQDNHSSEQYEQSVIDMDMSIRDLEIASQCSFHSSDTVPEYCKINKASEGEGWCHRHSAVLTKKNLSSYHSSYKTQQNYDNVYEEVDDYPLKNKITLPSPCPTTASSDILNNLPENISNEFENEKNSCYRKSPPQKPPRKRNIKLFGEKVTSKSYKRPSGTPRPSVRYWQCKKSSLERPSPKFNIPRIVIRVATPLQEVTNSIDKLNVHSGEEQRRGASTTPSLMSMMKNDEGCDQSFMESSADFYTPRSTMSHTEHDDEVEYIGMVSKTTDNGRHFLNDQDINDIIYVKTIAQGEKAAMSCPNVSLQEGEEEDEVIVVSPSKNSSQHNNSQHKIKEFKSSMDNPKYFHSYDDLLLILNSN